MNINSIKVITPDNLGKGITFNPVSKKWEVQSGFDCAALSALPSKPWKKGTTLLAKQDGECIQLTALDSIFQEIGVGIAADKTSAFTGETYNVTVTVTNTGESKNELTNLTVQKPLLGNYEILDVRTSKQAVDEVETLDQLNYNLKGLAKGGTFILRFSVKANDVGTYQFSATVNPNSALDQNTKNNTDTIILKSNTKIDTTYVPSVDCLAISLTDVASGVELRQVTAKERASKSLLLGIYGYESRENRVDNLYTDRTSLKGVQLRFSIPVTVAYYAHASGSGAAFNAAGSTFRVSQADDVFADPREPLPKALYTTPDAVSTTDNQTFVFTKDVVQAFIVARPRGANCRWQGWYVISKSADAKTVKLTNVVNAKVESYELISLNRKRLTDAQTLPSGKISTAYTGDTSFIPNLIVKSGQAASATIENVHNIPFAKTSGLVTITENRITVDANATSSDSLLTDYFKVTIED